MSDYRGLTEEMEQDGVRKAETDEEHGLHAPESHERLVCFMYLLMRDDLPTGTVSNKIADIADIAGFDGKKSEFSNPHLEALARDYANRIRRG